MKRTITAAMAISICVSAAVFGVPATYAADIVNWDEWSGRKELTINTGKPGVEIQTPVADAPVLIRLHTGNFDQFLSVKEDGGDLRFVGADEKLFPHRVELFDPINELALIWVRVPQLVPGAQNKLTMYYGNAKAAAVAASPESDATGIYDTNTVAVYHFDRSGAIQDSSRFGNHAHGVKVEPQPASLIAAGLRLTGGGAVTIPNSESLAWRDAGFTFSAWIKLAGAQKDAVILSRRDGAKSFVLGVKDNALSLRSPTATAAPVIASAVLTPGQWHHVAVAAGARTLVYLDGREVLASEVAAPTMTGPIEIGGAADKQLLIAELDELQFANVARSADWVKVAALGQGADAKLISYGEGAADEAHSSSYFASILQSVTVDGWAIIILLAIMAALSWWVMITKTMTVRRMARENEEFLESFHKLTNDPGALDRDDEDNGRASSFSHALFSGHQHEQTSPLYRLYHIGVQEIKHRFGKTDPRELHGRSLTPQAVDAIRAALDATLVRETQRLNRMMVAITIAISGGPFLGLLGTVVGVMITFAAIAATGDVNINAIAPGIAGALVATVAGLVVAIPALFGYNYLVTRIKDISVDMQVFVDEFISKVAEHYAADVRIDHEDAGRKRAV